MRGDPVIVRPHLTDFPLADRPRLLRYARALKKSGTDIKRLGFTLPT